MVIVSRSSCVSYGSKLVSQGIEPLLGRLLASHVPPFSIQLSRQIVEMPDVASLQLVQLWDLIEETLRKM